MRYARRDERQRIVFPRPKDGWKEARGCGCILKLKRAREITANAWRQIRAI